MLRRSLFAYCSRREKIFKLSQAKTANSGQMRNANFRWQKITNQNVSRALLVVAAVNHVEEQARVRLVELIVADFVYYQAGGPDQAC